MPQQSQAAARAETDEAEPTPAGGAADFTADQTAQGIRRGAAPRRAGIEAHDSAGSPLASEDAEHTSAARCLLGEPRRGRWALDGKESAPGLTVLLSLLPLCAPGPTAAGARQLLREALEPLGNLLFLAHEPDPSRVLKQGLHGQGSRLRWQAQAEGRDATSDREHRATIGQEAPVHAERRRIDARPSHRAYTEAAVPKPQVDSRGWRHGHYECTGDRGRGLGQGGACQLAQRDALSIQLQLAAHRRGKRHFIVRSRGGEKRQSADRQRRGWSRKSDPGVGADGERAVLALSAPAIKAVHHSQKPASEQEEGHDVLGRILRLTSRRIPPFGSSKWRTMRTASSKCAETSIARTPSRTST